MTRMPMGLSSSPLAFSRIMTMAMTGLRGIICLVYLDDLVVFSKTEREHANHLAQVFERLRETNLKIHPEKSHFFQRSIIFLGYQISPDGIKVDPAKAEKIQNWPTPKTTKEIQRFYGLANFYRRFIPDFAKMALPLSELLKKRKAPVWTDTCQQAFENLKARLCSPEVLAFPNFDGTFVVHTDASHLALGAVLSNADGRPVHFASRVLDMAEVNYSVIEKELLAIVFATKTFRPYLLGKPFVLRTDHAPLKWLFGLTDPSSRLTKFRLSLEPFQFTVEHIPGKENAATDALSRRITSEELKTMQRDLENSPVKKLTQEF